METDFKAVARRGFLERTWRPRPGSKDARPACPQAGGAGRTPQLALGRQQFWQGGGWRIGAPGGVQRGLLISGGTVRTAMCGFLRCYQMFTVIFMTS